MAISNLVSFLPISISGLGTRDATLIFLFSLINIQSELALSYSLLIFFTIFLAGGLFGYFCWWIKPLDFNKIR
tara:strand:- start:997 stop:1215 length:219 start_codon:yes stop_codon:yes gene_type:complete